MSDSGFEKGKFPNSPYGSENSELDFHRGENYYVKSVYEKIPSKKIPLYIEDSIKSAPSIRLNRNETLLTETQSNLYLDTLEYTTNSSPSSPILFVEEKVANNIKCSETSYPDLSSYPRILTNNESVEEAKESNYELNPESLSTTFTSQNVDYSREGNMTDGYSLFEQ